MNPPSALSVLRCRFVPARGAGIEEFFSDLWIQGEVSTTTRSQVGNRYFSLKDAQAALATVLFRGQHAGLPVKDGERVIAHGRITVYRSAANCSSWTDFVRPEGVGTACGEVEELRLRLDAEGLVRPGA